MGDFADDMIERQMIVDVDRFLEKYLKKRQASSPSTQTWTTNNGETLFVKDMEERHRQNCYNLLVRRHGAAQVNISTIGRAFLHYGVERDDGWSEYEYLNT